LDTLSKVATSVANMRSGGGVGGDPPKPRPSPAKDIDPRYSHITEQMQKVEQEKFLKRQFELRSQEMPDPAARMNAQMMRHQAEKFLKQMPPSGAMMGGGGSGARNMPQAAIAEMMRQPPVSILLSHRIGSRF